MLPPFESQIAILKAHRSKWKLLAIAGVLLAVVSTVTSAVGLGNSDAFGNLQYIAASLALSAIDLHVSDRQEPWPFMCNRDVAYCEPHL